MKPPIKTDLLVIGSGLAGLAFALKVAEKKQVLLVSKGSIQEMDTSNTSMAQGGMAAVISKGDTFDKHIEDTLRAGAGLCREKIVRQIIEGAPRGIQDLKAWGVQFDAKLNLPGQDDDWDLNHEGGHSNRRILHIQDQTGQAIYRSLLQRALENENIQTMENTFALDLMTNCDPRSMGPRICQGAYLYNTSARELQVVQAKVTMLASGGSGKIYLYTSNWSGATGDGIAMAYRAGARVANLEFTQFHPTCLYHPMARNFLISEALRGEGGKLLNAKGERFTFHYHKRGELAPRDIVARAIDAEMKLTGEKYVLLDMSHRAKNFLLEKFPKIFKTCQSFGYDLSREAIPVVPAAHYQCGGILVNGVGQTDLKGLYAIGENANTGLHGANRLASNSLLECLVMAGFSARHILKHWDRTEDFSTDTILPWKNTSLKNDDERFLMGHLWDEVRRLMWNYVGIVRSNERLHRAQVRLKYIRQEIEHHFQSFQLDTDLVELRNLALVADLTVQAALLRKESRGTHFNLDYPTSSKRYENPPRDTLLSTGVLAPHSFGIQCGGWGATPKPSKKS